MRNRVLMSFVDKTITIEKYSVRHERIISSKTYSVNTIKTLSLQILTSRGSSVFTIQIVPENRKKEKLITINNFLSAQRLFNLINNFATMINKGQSFNIAESVDNFLVYGRADFHDLDNYNSYIMNKHKKLNLRLSFS